MENINNHHHCGMPRERIVNLKKWWLRRSINSWRPGLDELMRAAHCLFQGTLGSQQVAASKRNGRKWFFIKCTRKLWKLLASVKTRCSKFGYTFWPRVVILVFSSASTVLHSQLSSGVPPLSLHCCTSCCFYSWNIHFISMKPGGSNI